MLSPDLFSRPCCLVVLDLGWRLAYPELCVIGGRNRDSKTNPEGSRARAIMGLANPDQFG